MGMNNNVLGLIFAMGRFYFTFFWFDRRHPAHHRPAALVARPGGAAQPPPGLLPPGRRPLLPAGVLLPGATFGHFG